MMAAIKTLRDPLKNSMKTQKGTSWHADRTLYGLGLEVPTGMLDFLGAWYAQGHEVSS